MLIQKLDEAFISALALDQTGYIMDYVKRVRPFVALSPPIVWAGPSTARIPRLHEPSFRVEDSKRVVHSTFSEKHLFVSLVQQAR